MRVYRRFIFVPIVLVLFSYLFYSTYRENKERVLKEFNSQQFALAKQASRSIESFFLYYEEELLFLSQLNFVSELNDQGKHLLSNFYNIHSDQIEAISFVDSNGILKYTYPLNESAIGSDVSNQEHVKTVLNTHKPTISDVFTSVQGYKAIAYHIPVISDDKYKGSLAILIPLDKLGKRFTENIITGKTGYGWVISKDGIELFNPITGQTGKPVKETYSKFPSVLELLDLATKESEGTTTCLISSVADTPDLLSRTLTAFYRIPLGNTYWTIIIFTPEKEVFSILTSFRNRLYIFLVLIILTIAAYFYLTFRESAVLKEENKRRIIENTLNESEKRFRIMFESSPAGIILIDEKGTIIEVNSAFCETLGYSREELLSNNIRLFSSPTREEEINSNIAKILSGMTMKNEVTNFRKDGTPCIISLYETRFILPDGNPGILSVSSDITEKKQANMELIAAKEKAEESDRLKSAFLTNMSHELRTPLNAIIGYSGLMIDTGLDAETNSNLKIISNSAFQLLSLVEDIIDISMIETEQIKITNKRVEINSVLNEIKEYIEEERLKTNKTGIKLVLNISSELTERYIFTDSGKLRQVLIILLKNSLKFTNEGIIEFGFLESEMANASYLKFFVKDTGIGIDKNQHNTIFNIFRQLDDTHSRQYGGTGIGLTIAKKIIEILGGEIWVESEIGKGSQFYFTIPWIKDNNSKAVFAAEPGTSIRT
jgi:PAS domain S-box-containing protein